MKRHVTVFKIIRSEFFIILFIFWTQACSSLCIVYSFHIFIHHSFWFLRYKFYNLVDSNVNILTNETSPCNCDLSLLKSTSNQLHKGNCNRLQMRRETLIEAVVTFFFCLSHRDDYHNGERCNEIRLEKKFLFCGSVCATNGNSSTIFRIPNRVAETFCEYTEHSRTDVHTVMRVRVVS